MYLVSVFTCPNSAVCSISVESSFGRLQILGWWLFTFSPGTYHSNSPGCHCCLWCLQLRLIPQEGFGESYRHMSPNRLPRCQFSSVQFSCSVVSNSLWPHGLQHSRPPCPSPTPRACSNSCPSSWWCHPTISFSAFSSRLHSFQASGSFPISQFSTSGGQSIGASPSGSVLPMNIQDGFPLGWTGLISLQLKGLSRVFSNTTVQKHQFLGAQLALCSNSHIHTWLLEKP